MGAFEAMIAIGSLLGNLCSSYLFAATDYVGVYMVAAFISFLGFVFTLCCIPESLERDSDAEVINQITYKMIIYIFSILCIC